MNKREIVLRVAGIFLSLFILYVVSFGPVLGFVISRADHRGGIWTRAGSVAAKTYWPIFWLCEQNRAVGSVMNRYLTFFTSVLAAPGEDPEARGVGG